ncbi:tetratricopeptide repeat protein [Coraliomargarita parva]|uniref:tetratricopeptide repeat protein n=1 Tax=Coraliomargarita parva TaxID=3014050 RepID=UPI0022B46188|nr:tetratricopeptide repeat protein [Coraliomargarita parva]
MFPPKSPKKAFLIALAAGASLVGAHAQDASQLAFSTLQAQANELVESGQLEQAMPLLKELVSRVEAAPDTEIKLDGPIFFIGTGYIQRYISSGQQAELKEALVWYDKLESDYPESRFMKEAVLKRVDIYRALQQNEDAVELMKKILGGSYNFILSYAEENKLLKDLTQIHYYTNKLEEGLPIFQKLLQISKEPDDVALAAAACFEAYVKSKDLDKAIELLPILARESEVRYQPRLNVALLLASDTMVNNMRYNDAALLLNLINTTDVMIEYNEKKLATKTTQLERLQALGGNQDSIDRLTQEIKITTNMLEQLKTLPSLRNELLVRRARNYTSTERPYEAFWMFYDLMAENPDHEQIQFYMYATFSNAMKIHKDATMIQIAEAYRARFPKGDYYSDISAAYIGKLLEVGRGEDFLDTIVDFLTTRPMDPYSNSLLAQWGNHLLSKGEIDTLLAQTEIWKNIHDRPVFEDGLFYWSGLAQLMKNQYPEALSNFESVLSKYPTSLYAEDSQLRKGACLYYSQDFAGSRNALNTYIKKYPQGNSLDQAYYFLGEIDFLEGLLIDAISHFQTADRITELQDIHNAVAFRIGTIYEGMGEYEKMANHFIDYINTYGDNGRLTDAVFELGRAYESLLMPVRMLALYQDNIEKYATAIDNQGVDALIEGYAEKYVKNKAMLEETVAFLKQLESDLEFREKIVTDRGFLFEFFYLNTKVDQSLYNRLREHPNFGPNLMDGLAPIADITSEYGEQLAQYPVESPEDFFRRLLAKYKAEKSRIAEARMLMGLYRIGIEDFPSMPYDADFLTVSTPRVLLYVADYERDKRLDFAVEAWNQVLTNYPQDDAAIVAYMRLADVSEQRGDLSTAINYLDQIRSLFPGSPKIPAVILREGELYSKQGNGDKAREQYQYILRVPDWRGILHARALFQTGESFMTEGEHAKAHGFFERTFLGYSHFGEWAAKAYLADAEALLAMGSREDAISTLKEAEEKLKDSAPLELYERIRAQLKELQP